MSSEGPHSEPVRYVSVANQPLGPLRAFAGGDGSSRNGGDPDALLDAANQASGPARNAWLAFLGLLAYLLITLAGVTHKDLLLNSPVTLPLVNVSIPLFSFFLTAPFLFLLVHLGLLVQHVVLAQKYRHYAEALPGEETARARDHASRKLVHNYVFSQMQAGTRPPLFLNLLMRLMVFASLTALPIIVLLYFQIQFLPYHDVAVTHAHRLAVLCDLGLLFYAHRFFAKSPRWIRLATRPRKGMGASWIVSRWRSLKFATVCASVIFFSFMVVNVPNGCIWPAASEALCFSLDRIATALWPLETGAKNRSREMFAPTAWMFGPDIEGANKMEQSLFRGDWFDRNLRLAEATLVREAPGLDVIAQYVLAGKTKEQAFVDLAKGHTLKGRNLRFGDFSRARFYAADMRFAKIEGADLSRASLQGALFMDASLQGAFLVGAYMDEASFKDSSLQGADLGGASLNRASLTNASMQGAFLNGASLQDAELSGASMQGVHLGGASLRAADLGEASMQGAFLRGASLQLASLIDASMQGADLKRASLQGAYLTGAFLQGADLSETSLLGADLNGASLQGASLRSASLQGADLSSASLQGADLRDAHVWLTNPPEPGQLEGARPMMPVLVKLLDKKFKEFLESLLKKKMFSDERKNERFIYYLRKRLAPLLDDEKLEEWRNSYDHLQWIAFSQQPDLSPANTAEVLASIACKDRAAGHIVKAITKRVLEKRWFQRDDLREKLYKSHIAKSLIDKANCPAAKHLGEETIVALQKLAADKALETR